jgi:hypothetical protein
MTVLLGVEKQKNIRLGVQKSLNERKSHRLSHGRPGRQDDEFVRVSVENILNKLALMGRRPGSLSVRLVQIRLFSIADL